MACRDGHKEVVKILLDQDIDVNTKDVSGWTPLLSACNGGHYDVVKLILDHPISNKIDFNVKAPEDYLSYTAFMYACRLGSVDIVDSFLKHSARIDFNCTNYFGQTAFMLAKMNAKLK